MPGCRSRGTRDGSRNDTRRRKLHPTNGPNGRKNLDRPGRDVVRYTWFEGAIDMCNGPPCMRNFFRTRIKGSRCVYCGERSQSDDHWPPASYCNTGFILPACLECNKLAWTFYPLEFLKRADYVKERLEDRYWSDINVANLWTREEINELGYWLGKWVRESYQRGLRAKRRIAWNAISYIASIDSRSFFVLGSASRELTEERLKELSNEAAPQSEWTDQTKRVSVNWDELNI